MFFKRQKKSGFVSSLLSGREDHIFLVKGKDATNRAAWYYVAVDRSKKSAFENLQGRQSMNLTDYGVILMSGYGEEPPEDVKRRMADEYGYREE